MTPPPSLYVQCCRIAAMLGGGVALVVIASALAAVVALWVAGFL